MAILLDERLDEEKTDTKKKEENTPDPLEQEIQAEEQQEQQEEVVPDKYKGKTADELVRMHQEAEKLLGRQSSEVGELRKVVDTYIQTQLSEQQESTKKQNENETVEEIDFFSDPERAVKQAIDRHPKIREAEAVNAEYRKSTTLSKLQAAHPDMSDILNDGKFGEWIKASKIRTQLFVQADKQYDYDAAEELFNLWKDRRQIVAQTAQVEKQGRKQAVKKASTGAGSGGGAQKGSRKIYRRADIIKLMETDPDRYQSLSDEIFKAYKEKRVR